MQSRWTNVGMWVSMLVAICTSIPLYLSCISIEQRISVISGLVVTLAGIYSNPKEGLGYTDKETGLGE